MICSNLIPWKEPGGLPLAQLAFGAAKAGAKALLCGPKSGLSGQQLPAGEETVETVVGYAERGK